jgi:hypothetical protein
LLTAFAEEAEGIVALHLLILPRIVVLWEGY